VVGGCACMNRYYSCERLKKTLIDGSRNYSEEIQIVDVFS